MSEKKYINRGDKATKTGFGEGLRELGAVNNNLIALGADITASVGMDMFSEAYPERFISMGIAEQNIAGVAAGLALSGKLAVFATYGVFAAHRAADQIRISICYNNLHVIIGGAHAGISVGPDGATHQALEDLSVMRALPNMTVLSPCDAAETRQAVLAAAEIHGPVYIRFGRAPVPDFSMPDKKFIPGKAETLLDGQDISIIATGHMVWEALQAAAMLAKKGISARVVNVNTIKPLDKTIITKAARETGCLFTIEEHQHSGGLGSAVAEAVAESHPAYVYRIGMPDTFGESGQPSELMDKYGLNAKHLCKRIRQVMDGKKT